MPSMTLDELSKHIRKIDFCMLNTSIDRNISSRPMSNNGDVEYDGDSWFFSYADTRKVEEIRKNSNVTLTFTAPPSLLGKPGIFIAIEGSATILQDKALFQAHWTGDLDRWFQQGVDTPGLALLKVSAKSISHWDGEDQGTVQLAAS